MILRRSFSYFLVVLMTNFLISSTTQKKFSQTGKASYYAEKFEGRRTSSGENYRKNAFSAAHQKLPFGTKVRVTNIANGKSVVVKINDRGPFTKNRIIDLSLIAAKKIEMIQDGVIKVKIEAVSGDTPLG